MRLQDLYFTRIQNGIRVELQPNQSALLCIYAGRTRPTEKLPDVSIPGRTTKLNPLKGQE
jgi:hypothetical protein